jgi:hypothetical protein
MKLRKYNSIWYFLMVITLYFGVHQYTQRVTSQFVANWVALIGASFMFASTTPVAWRAFKNGISTNVDKFVFSYWFVWTILLGKSISIIIPKSSVYSVDQVNGPVSVIMGVGIAVAAGFGASATITGKTPLREKEVIMFVAAAAFSGVVAGIAIGLFIVNRWSA